MNTLQTLITLILGMTIPYLVQRADRSRLAPAERAYAWNAATWGAAIYAFGPLSMMAWLLVTRWPRVLRRSREGQVLTAIAVAAGLVLLGVVIAVAMSVLIGLFADLFADPARPRR